MSTKFLKSSFVIIAMVLIQNRIYSQSVAQDWTKTDCDGTEYNLYSELDNGKIVLMDFVMMGCASCITASTYLQQIYEDYQVSHPGKVLVLSMAYVDYYTCNQMAIWKGTYGFSFPIITKCASDVSYYGGMGMPTIAVVGGVDHKVYYKTLGFNASKDAEIRTAIDLALSEAPVAVKDIHDPDILKTGMSVKMINDMLSITVGEIPVNNSKLYVYNIFGSKIFDSSIVSNTSQNIDISEYSSGIYFAVLTASGQKSKIIKFIK